MTRIELDNRGSALPEPMARIRATPEQDAGSHGHVDASV